MKHHITLLIGIAAIVSFSNGFGQQPQNASLSRLPAAKQAELFSLIADQFLVVEGGNLLQVKKPVAIELSSGLENQRVFRSSKVINYTIDAFDDNLTENGLLLVDSNVSQSIGGDKYLVDSHSALIEVPGNETLVEESRIVGVAKCVGTYEYITVQGAARRIRHFMIVSARQPTQEELVQKLSSGTLYQVVLPTQLKCPQCGGLGTIRNDPRDSLKSSPCNVCDGKRKIPGGQLVNVTK